MRNNNTLKTHINDFIEARLERNRRRTLKLKKCKKILSTYHNLFDKIETIINNINLTDSYKAAESELYSIQLEEAYKMGFKDSMQIFLHNNINH